MRAYPKEKQILQTFIERNKKLSSDASWFNVHRRIIDICLCLYRLELPAYVLLEIFDWFPCWSRINQKKKIDLIINIKKSCDAIVKSRKPKKNKFFFKK